MSSKFFMHRSTVTLAQGARIALLCSALAAAAGPAAAQYIWKDAQGQTHVSDLPPPKETPDSAILKRPAPGKRAQPAPAAQAASAASGAGAAKTPVDPELEARRKRQDQEATAKAKADEERQAAVRAQNCQRARQQLASLTNGQRLVQFNDKGERVVVDDATRASEEQVARQAIATDCR